MYKIDHNKLIVNDVEHHFKRYKAYISDDGKYKFYTKKDLDYYNNTYVKPKPQTA
jgi:hypothetical protein